MPIPIVAPSNTSGGAPNVILNPFLSLAFHGPTILAEVGFSAALFQMPTLPSPPPLQSGPVSGTISAGGTLSPPVLVQPPAPNTPFMQAVMALIDTGARTSCIDDDLAVALNLPLVNVVSVGGVGGSGMLNQYLAKLTIPQLNFSKAGAFIGAKMTQAGMMHKALIGRDFLSNMLLVYDGPSGRVKLAV